MKLISHPQLELRNYTFTLPCAFMRWSWIGTGCNLFVLLQCSFGKWLSFILSAHPSVCMKQFGSHQMDFHEILRWEFLLKFVDTLQLSLKSDLGYECTKTVSFCRHFLTCYCCYWACPLMGKVFPEMRHLAFRYAQLATEMFTLMCWALIPTNLKRVFHEWTLWLNDIFTFLEMLACNW